METILHSSLSYIAMQHQAHKDRQERIRNAAFKDLAKQPDPPKPFPSPPPPPQIQYYGIFDLIMRRTCLRYHVRKEDVLSKRRLGNVVKARHAIIVMLYRFTKWTTLDIADKIGRDPSNVFYVLQKQEDHPIDFTDLQRDIQDEMPLIMGGYHAEQ